MGLVTEHRDDAARLRAADGQGFACDEDYGCLCDPREATLDADLNIICAECGAVIERYKP